MTCACGYRMKVSNHSFSGWAGRWKETERCMFQAVMVLGCWCGGVGLVKCLSVLLEIKEAFLKVGVQMVVSRRLVVGSTHSGQSSAHTWQGAAHAWQSAAHAHQSSLVDVILVEAAASAHARQGALQVLVIQSRVLLLLVARVVQFI